MKRSPIKRGKALERGTKGLKRAPMKRTPSQRQKAHMGRMDDLRPVVLARAAYRCEARDVLPDVACGTLPGIPALAVHHRLPTGQHGPDTLANTVALCVAHHQHVHDHPAESHANGLLVPSWRGAPSVAWTPPEA